jgi:hypothetical protein
MLDPEEKELEAICAHFAKEYKLIAELESNDLEEIFSLTNHVTHDWTENIKISLKIPGPHRSTSPGDIVKLPNNSYHLCLTMGWKDVTKYVRMA